MHIDNETLFRRLQDNYPYGYALARLIAIKYTEIYKQVYPDSGLQQGESRDLTFHVGLDDKGNPSLKMDQSSTILLVAIAESLLKLRYPGEDSEGKNLEQNEKDFLYENKVCPNPECGAINKITDKQCGECGTEM
jgi:hypothetical protein